MLSSCLPPLLADRRDLPHTMVGNTHAGALTFVHRSESSPNQHPHVRVFDGVLDARGNEASYFCRARSLGNDELRDMVERLAVQVATRLRKHRLVRNEQATHLD